MDNHNPILSPGRGNLVKKPACFLNEGDGIWSAMFILNLLRSLLSLDILALCRILVLCRQCQSDGNKIT